MKTKINVKPNLGKNLPQHYLNAKDILGQDLYFGDIIAFSTRKGLSFGMLLGTNYIYSIILKNKQIFTNDNIHYHYIYNWYAARKKFYSFGRYCIKINPNLISERDMALYNGYTVTEIIAYEKCKNEMRLSFVNTIIRKEKKIVNI